MKKVNIMAGFLAGILFSIGILHGNTVYSYTGDAPFPVQITAHRGGAALAPENTVSALRKAAELETGWAEIDVQETKDGELVVFHDSKLKRITGSAGEVWNTSFAEIRKLDAGSSFQLDYAGEKIPTLQEAINACGPSLKLNIEIKDNGHSSPELVAKVMRTIQSNHFEERCTVTSMNYQFLETVKVLNPNIRTGFIAKKLTEPLSELTAADFFSVKAKNVDEKLVMAIHEAGKQLHVWTVNSSKQATQMINLGVDNIITDNPLLLMHKPLSSDNYG